MFTVFTAGVGKRFDFYVFSADVGKIFGFSRF